MVQFQLSVKVLFLRGNSYIGYFYIFTVLSL